MIKHIPHLEADVTFLSTEEGGRQGPVFSGYRPAHLVKDDYLTTGQHEYIDKEKVEPGETAKAEIFLISPEVYPHCLWVGKELALHEGAHLVGYAKVTKIMNKLLEKNS